MTSTITPDPAPSPWRRLCPGQVSRVHIYDLERARDEVVYETGQAVAEAPNWTRDGSQLVFNQDGELYGFELASGTVRLIDSGRRSAYNNDHVLDPDAEHIFATAEDGHIYRFPLTGGPAQRVTREDDALMARYLHGVSPDGRTLVHIGGVTRNATAIYNIYSFDRVSGQTTALTDSPQPHDGAEFSPDGRWIYFNAELGSKIPGHAQLFRMTPQGDGLEQLTADERVNWFPHLSPDGRSLVYLSFPPGTLGHPANQPVQLVVTDADVTHEQLRFDLYGGQGSLNVNSWAPDSRRFAYVDYPLGNP